MQAVSRRTKKAENELAYAALRGGWGAPLRGSRRSELSVSVAGGLWTGWKWNDIVLPDMQALDMPLVAALFAGIRR